MSLATVTDWVLNDTELITGIVCKFVTSGTCCVETEFTVVTDWVTGEILVNTDAVIGVPTLFTVSVIGVMLDSTFTVEEVIEVNTVVFTKLTLATADVEVVVKLVTNGAVVIVTGLITAFTVEVVALWTTLAVVATIEDNTGILLEVIVFTTLSLVRVKEAPTLASVITRLVNISTVEVASAAATVLVVEARLVITSTGLVPVILWTKEPVVAVIVLIADIVETVLTAVIVAAVGEAEVGTDAVAKAKVVIPSTVVGVTSVTTFVVVKVTLCKTSAVSAGLNPANILFEIWLVVTFWI